MEVGNKEEWRKSENEIQKREYEHSSSLKVESVVESSLTNEGGVLYIETSKRQWYKMSTNFVHE